MYRVNRTLLKKCYVTLVMYLLNMQSVNDSDFQNKSFLLINNILCKPVFYCFQKDSPRIHKILEKKRDTIFARWHSIDRYACAL